MSQRHRDRAISMVGGTATWHDETLGPQSSSWGTTDNCDDIVGDFGGENPLVIEHTSNLYWTLQGRMRINGYGWTYNGYVRTGVALGHLPPSTEIPSDNWVLSEALAQTNPNRPHVDLPVFLFELRDIPRLLSYFNKLGLKMFRDRPIRSIAEAYLTWEYGISLFMKDVFRMLEFVNRTEETLRWLRNLQNSKKGYLSRNRTIWEDTVLGAETNVFASPLYQEDNHVSYRVRTHRFKWASTKWVPTEDISSFSDDELRNRANRAVLGLDISFATLWEAMPWSWLIDWFSNVGDLMSLSRNSIPVKHDGSCVMQTTSTSLTEVKWVSGGGEGVCIPDVSTLPVRITKSRVPMVFGPLPEFNLPFLNGKQLSILSAIAVTRM